MLQAVMVAETLVFDDDAPNPAQLQKIARFAGRLGDEPTVTRKRLGLFAEGRDR